jgi:hypothetical protein
MLREPAEILQADEDHEQPIRAALQKLETSP